MFVTRIQTHIAYLLADAFGHLWSSDWEAIVREFGQSNVLPYETLRDVTAHPDKLQDDQFPDAQQIFTHGIVEPLRGRMTHPEDQCALCFNQQDVDGITWTVFPDGRFFARVFRQQPDPDEQVVLTFDNAFSERLGGEVCIANKGLAPWRKHYQRMLTALWAVYGPKAGRIDVMEYNPFSEELGNWEYHGKLRTMAEMPDVPKVIFQEALHEIDEVEQTLTSGRRLIGYDKAFAMVCRFYLENSKQHTFIPKPFEDPDASDDDLYDFPMPYDPVPIKVAQPDPQEEARVLLGPLADMIRQGGAIQPADRQHLKDVFGEYPTPPNTDMDV